MYKLSLIILILIILLIINLDINNNKFKNNTNTNTNDTINTIDTINTNDTINKVELKNINNENNNFHKLFFSSSMNDEELEKININKGSLTIHNIINEAGGSSYYNKYYIDSNISNNIVNYNNDYSTYTNLITVK